MKVKKKIPNDRRKKTSEPLYCVFIYLQQPMFLLDYFKEMFIIAKWHSSHHHWIELRPVLFNVLPVAFSLIDLESIFFLRPKLRQAERFWLTEHRVPNDLPRFLLGKVANALRLIGQRKVAVKKRFWCHVKSRNSGPCLVNCARALDRWLKMLLASGRRQT